MKMCCRFLVEASLQRPKERVELLGLDHRPWDDVDLSTVKPRNEVRLLLALHNLLEFEAESIFCVSKGIRCL
jgi:hypothetical protein